MWSLSEYSQGAFGEGDPTQIWDVYTSRLSPFFGYLWQIQESRSIPNDILWESEGALVAEGRQCDYDHRFGRGQSQPKDPNQAGTTRATWNTSGNKGRVILQAFASPPLSRSADRAGYWNHD